MREMSLGWDRFQRPGWGRRDGRLGCQPGAARARSLSILEVEHGWRDVKQVLDLRPVYHRLEDGIRAHVPLCWLALLLARIGETRTHTTWPRARTELQRLHVGTFTGPAGLFRQTSTPNPEVRRLHTALDLALPPRRILDLDPERP
jgi:hypothetical protein